MLDVVTDIDARWSEHLGLVEYAVEDAPMLPDDWGDETVPLSSLVRGKGQSPTRLVLFRRPIELRCETRSDLDAMVLTVLVEQVSELLGLPPEEIDPGYDAESAFELAARTDVDLHFAVELLEREPDTGDEGQNPDDPPADHGVSPFPVGQGSEPVRLSQPW